MDWTTWLALVAFVVAWTLVPYNIGHMVGYSQACKMFRALHAKDLFVIDKTRKRDSAVPPGD